jgi:hypothetical protein
MLEQATEPTVEQRELAFIVSNSLDKPDPNARQLIRSQSVEFAFSSAMSESNARAPLRTKPFVVASADSCYSVMRRRNRRKPVVEPRLRSWVINQNSSRPSQTSSATGTDLYVPLPARVGTDWPVGKFAYDMPPYALDLAFRCEFRPRCPIHQVLKPCTRLFRSSTLDVSYRTLPNV